MKMNRKVLGLIFDSCGGHCYYCGEKLDPFGTWQADHMHPLAQGGADTFYNIVAACRTCNGSKGNRTVDEFRAAVIRRALNSVTNSKEILDRFPIGLQPDLVEAVSLLGHAEDLIVNADLIFHGEATDLPRKNDSLFSAEMDAAMQEFDENSEGDNQTDPIM
jgi:hypothetical protein